MKVPFGEQRSLPATQRSHPCPRINEILRVSSGPGAQAFLRNICYEVAHDFNCQTYLLRTL